MSEEPMFPILNCAALTRIPWRLVEPGRAQAQKNHSQTLERLAERGGLGPGEVRCAIEGKPLWPHFDNRGDVANARRAAEDTSWLVSLVVADLRARLAAAEKERDEVRARVCDVCGKEEGHGHVWEDVEVCRGCYEGKAHHVAVVEQERDAARAEAAAMRRSLELATSNVTHREACGICGAEGTDWRNCEPTCWVRMANEVLQGDAGRALLDEVRGLREQVADFDRDRDAHLSDCNEERGADATRASIVADLRTKFALNKHAQEIADYIEQREDEKR